MDDKITFKRIVENFPPSWYAMVMSISGLGVSLHYSSEVVSWFYWVGYTLFLLSIFFFVLLLIPWLLRFVIAWDRVKESLNNPIQGSFFSTMPISLVLISFGMIVFQEHLPFKELISTISLVVFGVGTSLVILFGVIAVINLFFNNKVEITHPNFGWFIPPVAHVISTRVGFELLGIFQNNPSLGEILFWLSLFCLAIGLFMYVFIGSIVMYRYILSEVPYNNLAPTTFIQLAPLGIMSSIFVKMISLFGSSSIGILVMFSILFWSFGVWWLIVSTITLFKLILENRIKFALSWWAFVFPLVAMGFGTLGMANVSSQQASTVFMNILLVLNILTFIVFLVVLFETVRRTVKGDLLKGIS
ncbi:MAG: hypothetical protein RMJ37_05460 [Spirochaetia bacterium]|nr:hypothetical protein [Spirochaetota bacterium]MCX8096432.1 hypothetical protein [Spirochaetota bacterium]MDW8112764.1 hypothetical protein [Spirochaetia bacterium]